MGIAVTKRVRRNDEIDASEVRVIRSDGEQEGVMGIAAAIQMAYDEGLDLVEVSPNADPPVCRIMDFGKFNYDKKKRQTKNKSHQTKLKEIRVRPKTGEHDIGFKVKQAIGFLEHNDKVQVTVLFRGRENAHIDEGRKVMDHIIELLSEHGKVESNPSQQPRRMVCTIAPNKS